MCLVLLVFLFLSLSLLVDLQMLEVSALDPSIWLQVILRQSLIDLLRHLHCSIPEASLNQQEEEIQLRSLNVLCLQFSYHLEHLKQSEVLFPLVLHPKSRTPHVDPGDVHIGSLCSTYIRDVYLLKMEDRFEGLLTLSPVVFVGLKFVL